MTKYLLLNRITLANGIEIKAGKEFDAASFDLAGVSAAGGVLALQPVPSIVAQRVAQVVSQETRGRRQAELDDLTAVQAETAALATNTVGVAEKGTFLGLFSILNVAGTGASVSDGGGGVAVLNVPGSAAGVPPTRDLAAGDGLTGGGDLTADRVFSVGAPPDGSIQVNADSVQVGTLATDGQHGSRGGGAQHAVATALAAGFMGSGDKTKLDGIASGATNTLLSDITPSAASPSVGGSGASAGASRSDHAHPLASAAPVSVDKSAGAEGTASSLSRSDHKHDVSTAAPVGVGTANAEGVASSLARSDHVHALPFVPVQAALAAATGDVSVNGVKIADLGAPLASTDAATKGYADGLVGVSDYKASCRVATLADVGLVTGGLLTVDGVSLTSGDRVLVRAQALPEQNGIYVAVTGSWARALDADGAGEVGSGLTVYVSEGAANAATYWALTTTDPVAIGTTPIAFEMMGLLSSSAPVNVDKSAAVVGTSFRSARADHKHDASTAVPVTISSGNAEGSASSLARSDHVHAHGSQGGGSQHAIATAIANGFMSAADKAKVNLTASGFQRYFLLMGA